MNKLRNAIALAVLLALTASNLILIQSVSAVTAPSVPEFSVKFIQNSYSVATMDPYTGQTTTTRNPNNTLQVTIKNQPFTDNSRQLYYNIRVRPHFDGNWTELYPLRPAYTGPYNWETKTWKQAQYLYFSEMPEETQTPKQTNGQETIIILTLNEDSFYPLSNLPDNAKVDFQVQAIIGHPAQCWAIQHPFYPEYGGYYEDAAAYDSSSDWSGTQTITIGDDSALSAITDIAGNWQENNWIAVAASAVIVAVVIAVAAVMIKRAKKQELMDSQRN